MKLKENTVSSGERKRKFTHIQRLKFSSVSRYSVYGRDNLQYFKGVIIRSSKELEHHDVNIISKNRYKKSTLKAVFQIMEVSS